MEEQINDHLAYNQLARHIKAGGSIVKAMVRKAPKETVWHVEPDALLGIYYKAGPFVLTATDAWITGIRQPLSTITHCP